MVTLASSIKLYEFLRNELNLPENKAYEVMDIIQAIVKEQSLKKDSPTGAEFVTKADLAETQFQLLKWMFISCVTEVTIIVAYVLLIVKRFSI